MDIYGSWFSHHFVGKTLINVTYCDTAEMRFVVRFVGQLMIIGTLA